MNKIYGKTRRELKSRYGGLGNEPKDQRHTGIALLIISYTYTLSLTDCSLSSFCLYIPSITSPSGVSNPLTVRHNEQNNNFIPLVRKQ